MHLLIIKVMLMISVVLYYRLPRTFGATRTRLITSNKKDIKQPSKDAVTDDKSTFCSFVIEPGDDCCQASSEPQMITFSCRDSISLPLQRRSSAWWTPTVRCANVTSLNSDGFARRSTALSWNFRRRLNHSLAATTCAATGTHRCRHSEAVAPFSR